MNLALAILPLIFTLAAGYVLVISKVIAREHWVGIEVLSFRLLIPAVLIDAISGADLSGAAVGPFAAALIGAVALGGVVVLIMRALVRDAWLPNPSFTTLFQTTTRFNGFIALAAAELLRGPSGLALIAVAMAVLIPLINVANIVVMAVFGTGRASVRGVGRTILLNPLVQASLLGLALNLTGIEMPGFVSGTLDLIGRAALGVGVLAVGAGISLRRMARPSGVTLVGLLLHPFLGLGWFLLLAYLFGLPPEHRLVGALLFGAPAASNGYVVARQMGGDAPLYADILTWQTLLSTALLPVLALMLAP